MARRRNENPTDPEAFRTVAVAGDRLDTLNEGQLRQALRLVLEHDRDLGWVLDAVAEPSDPATALDVNSTPYYAKAMADMPEEYGWRGTSSAAHALGRVTEIGNEFLDGDRLAHAVAAYAGTLEAAIETYQDYHDEGQISDEIGRCIKGLGKCLAKLPVAAPSRATIIEAFTAVCEFDGNRGGVGLDDGIVVILRKHATPDERLDVAQTFRDTLAGLKKDDSWTRKYLGGLIADLEMDSLDDESFIKLCKETGRYVDLADRLLSLKRHDEADTVAKGRKSDYETLQLAEVYARHQRTEVFASLLESRADTTNDVRVWEWLREHLVKKRQFPRALEMARREFKARPTAKSFDTCLEMGRRCDMDLNAELLAWLRAGKHFDTLLDVLLKQGNYDGAAEVFKLRGRRHSWSFHGGDLEIAGRFAPHRPDVAIAIYRDEAKCAIAQRGRGNYAHGCKCLRKWRETCQTPADREAFSVYVRTLTIEAKKLPALRDEMTKADLVPFNGG